MYPCLHVSMSPCFHVSISMSPCLHVSLFMSPCPEFCKQKTELKENGNFCLFSVNGKWKQQSFVYLLQTETENVRLFSLVTKWSTIINDCCFRKHSHLGLKETKTKQKLYYVVPAPTKRKPCTAAVQCTQPSVMRKVSKSAFSFLSMPSFLYKPCHHLLLFLLLGGGTWQKRTLWATRCPSAGCHLQQAPKDII